MRSQSTVLDAMDRFDHLAKVRVAGSNPVFRSKAPSAMAAHSGRTVDAAVTKEIFRW